MVPRALDKKFRLPRVDPCCPASTGVYGAAMTLQGLEGDAAGWDEFEAAVLATAPVREPSS